MRENQNKPNPKRSANYQNLVQKKKTLAHFSCPNILHYLNLQNTNPVSIKLHYTVIKLSQSSNQKIPKPQHKNNRKTRPDQARPLLWIIRFKLFPIRTGGRERERERRKRRRTGRLISARSNGQDRL